MYKDINEFLFWTGTLLQGMTIVIFIDSGPDDYQHPVQMSQCLSLVAAPPYRGDSL